MLYCNFTWTFILYTKIGLLIKSDLCIFQTQKTHISTLSNLIDFYLNFFHSQFISKISHHFFNGHKIRPLIRKLLIYELCEIIKCYGPNNIPHSCNWVYWDWVKYSVHILRGPCLIKHSNYSHGYIPSLLSKNVFFA